MDGTIRRSSVQLPQTVPVARLPRAIDPHLQQLADKTAEGRASWSESDFGSSKSGDVRLPDMLIMKDQLGPGIPYQDCQGDPAHIVRMYLDQPAPLNLDRGEQQALRQASDSMRSLVQQCGHALTPAQCEIARRVGVEHPEHVRYVCMSPKEFEQQFPAKLEELIGLPATGLLALTLDRDAIVFVGDDPINAELLAHELRHVRQAEIAHESGTNFLDASLAELQESGYHRSALEIDACVYEADPRVTEGLPETFKPPSASRL